MIADTYQFRAIELKQKQLQRPDIEAIPTLESDDARALIEFQDYQDPFMLRRAARNLILASDYSTNGKPVISVVIYTNHSCKRSAKPLRTFMPDMTINPVREYVLVDYAEGELLSIDPRLILLAPFTVPTDLDKAQLQQKNLKWTKQIHHIYTDTQERSKALNIFGLLLLNRFRYLEEGEVIAMLNIDLMQSRAVQQVMKEASKKGKRG